MNRATLSCALCLLPWLPVCHAHTLSTAKPGKGTSHLRQLSVKIPVQRVGVVSQDRLTPRGLEVCDCSWTDPYRDFKLSTQRLFWAQQEDELGYAMAVSGIQLMACQLPAPMQMLVLKRRMQLDAALGTLPRVFQATWWQFWKRRALWSQ